MHLVYEIYLRNFGGTPLSLRRLEVEALGAEDAAGPPLASFEDEELGALLRPVGTFAQTDGADGPQVPPGGSMIAFLFVSLDVGASVPNALQHRIVAGNTAVEGARVDIHQSDLPVFGPPLRGSDWRISGGPDNDSGHRCGMFVSDGLPQISRRYAMDWKRVEDGATFAGDERDNQSYHAYGEEVLAVTDARVVDARDSAPENIPGERPRVTSLDAIQGNFVTLDLSGGMFARYLHLQTGSVRVEPGDRVRQGQVIGLVGNSGDSREPHLHFEVTTAASLLGGEGVPYVFEEFWVSPSSDTPAQRYHIRELPLPDDESVITFDMDPATTR